MSDKKISEDGRLRDRRSVIKAVGGSAVMFSVSGLAACGGNEDTASPAPAASQPEPAAPQPVSQPAQTPEQQPMDNAQTMGDSGAASADSMPRLDPADPQARALAYVHDASEVNATEQPRYEAGQLCSNCALYTGDDGEAWGPCSIFPGKLVNADGWCVTWAPKA